MPNDTTNADKGRRHPELTWEIRFQNEIRQAKAARATGNEGMARVCARRAAGIAIGEYLQRQGLLTTNSSTYDLLREMQAKHPLSAELDEIIEHLLLRVTPKHTLPMDADGEHPIDLIAEARLLARQLLADK